MPQAQYSTQEQLEALKILVADMEYDLDDLCDSDMRGILKIANFNGLYDAADFVAAQAGKDKISLDWC